MTAAETALLRGGPRYGEGRAALLAAAVRVGATRGLRHLTYRSVAAEAGVAHGLVAHHFGSRDALIEEALQFSLDHGVASLSSAPGSGDVSALFVGVTSWFEQDADDAVFQYELILESRRRPELRPHVERLYEAYREALRVEMKACGLPDDLNLVHLVFAALDGLVFQQVCLGQTGATEAALDQLRGLLSRLR
ncbi:TetR/AcrR family transcriptional regulator [Blastococcus deserti]|uniref:TetR/AcrR family transcriptional regulator n=1 Tax=Blastococcus deserti TaxID=2259033 RepID=A0ABW4XCS7_9ACTN